MPSYWPVAPSGAVVSIAVTAPITSTGGTTPNIGVTNFGGDSGAGGTKGTVPAPGAGDAAANKFLKASGGWVTPPATGVNSVSGTAPITSSGGSTPAIGCPPVAGDSGAGGTSGLVPAPGAGDAAAGKYLGAGGTWSVPSGGGSGITVPNNFLLSFGQVGTGGGQGNPFANPLYAGFKMQTGYRNLVIKGMGRFMVAGNTQSHILKVKDVTGADVAGATCTVNMTGGTTGAIVQGLFASPITLAANSYYYFLSQEFQGGDQMIDDLGESTGNPFIGMLIGSAWIASNGAGIPALHFSAPNGDHMYVGIDITL